MGENEFSSNGSRASVVDVNMPSPRLDEILSIIARLAQRQSKGPIPLEEFEREIGAIERILDGLPNHEITDVFGNFVRGEIIVLKERNMRDAKELRDDPRVKTLASMVREIPKPEGMLGFRHRTTTVPKLKVA